jgi:hypothetical protein
MVVLVIAMNFFLVSYFETARKYDIAFLHNNCKPMFNLENLSSHITYDRSIDGALYIFNLDPMKNGPTDFEAAFRSIFSEFLCVPGLGCATAPRLSNRCKG